MQAWRIMHVDTCQRTQNIALEIKGILIGNLKTKRQLLERTRYAEHVKH